VRWFGGDAGTEVAHAEFDLRNPIAARQPGFSCRPCHNAARFQKIAEDLVHGGRQRPRTSESGAHFPPIPARNAGVHHHAAHQIDGVSNQRGWLAWAEASSLYRGSRRRPRASKSSVMRFMRVAFLRMMQETRAWFRASAAPRPAFPRSPGMDVSGVRIRG